MYRSLITTILLSVFVAGSADAQITGKLKKQAKDALKGATHSDERGADSAAPVGSASQARPSANKDKDRKYPPGVSYSSLLNGVHLLAKNGKFSHHQIQATFIPSGCSEGFTVLRTADGKELFQFDWRPQTLEKPYFLLDVTKTTDLRTGSAVAGAVDLSTPGDYVLDFYLPTEHFYTFPFAVARIGSDDPFGDGECFTANGDWRDCGYLYYREAQPDQSLTWKIWLRNDACNEKSIKIRVEIASDADGSLVCTSRENTTYSVQPQWSRREFDMVFPEGKEVPHGTYFKAKDLLDTDGAYTLTMKIDDEPYGTWKFKVEGGKLNYAGRTLRGEADPLTFIEGGRDAWWYAREDR